MGKITVTRLRSGAYVADTLAGETDWAEWQTWLFDPAMTVEATDEGLLIQGTTSLEKRAFTGLVSRRLYPPDAMLICEMKVPCDLTQSGTYGFVVHLCNRLVGDEVRTLQLPDNNSEITFGRMGEKLGWFHWWYDHSGVGFHKWAEEEEPRSPLGDEGQRFQTVAVEYDEPTRTTRAFLLTGGAWEQVGQDRSFRKLCSSIELKIDAQGSGLELALVLRNCRLFPHPARTPVTVYVGKTAQPARNAQVQLLDAGGQPLASGTTDSDGVAELLLPVDACYPLGGGFRVESGGEVWDSAPIEPTGV
ncbi:MAG: hypothetical protein AMJ38_03320, partial [Dehalococcoidia bacterium DG_22]